MSNEQGYQELRIVYAERLEHLRAWNLKRLGFAAPIHGSKDEESHLYIWDRIDHQVYGTELTPL